MKIELQHPFKDKWKAGYIVTNSENRKNVILYNSQQDRTTISLARYLMSVFQGCEIPEGIEVDHIDNDKTNDDISNLQLLMPDENRAKGRSREMVTLICPQCKQEFTRERRQTHLVKGGAKTFCSRKCYNNSR